MHFSVLEEIITQFQINKKTEVVNVKAIKDKDVEKVILDFIHDETGYATPWRNYCYFEDLIIEDMITTKDQNRHFRFRYHFDEDGFSQYDKTHTLVGLVILDSDNTILS